MRPKLAVYAGTVIALSTGILAARALGASVTNNGQTMTTDVKVINGKVYVPLNDVAKSFNEVVVKTANGYALTAAGGANQMATRFIGKVGETVFTGQFSLTVTSVETTTSYQQKYIPNPGTMTADPGQKFIVLHCRVKNGMTSRQEIALSTSPYSGNDDTTLTDDHQQTYQPILYHGDFTGYDVHADDTAPTGIRMLPGSAVDFNVIFNLPAAATPKDFIFGILKYDRAKKAKQTDIRISLQ
jgi:hypothetical protein